MSRFSSFTNDELDVMESAFCNEGLPYLVDEIRTERRNREKESMESCRSTTDELDDLELYFTRMGFKHLAEDVHRKKALYKLRKEEENE